MPTQVLEIKLGACLTMPTRRCHALLAEVARDCNLARNGALRHWIRWREDNPDWQPAQRRRRDGSPKVSAAGKPVLEDPAMSQAEENEMYYAARRLAPRVSSNVITHVRGEVLAKLKAKMPWNHPGSARYFWQGILAYEISAPSWRGEAIPVPNNSAAICYCGEFNRETNAEAMRHCGASSCVVRFPLLSKNAGMRERSPICRLEVRQLSKGNRAVVRRIAHGELKMSDSKLVHKRGAWFFQLTYKQPARDHALTIDRVAVLTPTGPDCRRGPFELLFPPEGDASGRAFQRRWYVGDAAPLEAEYRRLAIRRRVIRNRYKDGAKRGHGKQGFYRALRPFSRAFCDMEDRFTKHLVTDIVAACIKQDCGALAYREPTMPLRDKLWFGVRGIPFPWTQFAGRLKFKMAANAIEWQTTKRLGVAQHRQEYGWGQDDEKAS